MSSFKIFFYLGMCLLSSRSIDSTKLMMYTDRSEMVMFNPDYINLYTIDIEKVSQTQFGISSVLDIKQDIVDATVRMKVDKMANNEYKTPIAEFEIDYCDFVSSEDFNESIKKGEFGNFTTCTDDKMPKGRYVADKEIIAIKEASLPETGNYRANMQMWIDSVKLAEYNIYFVVKKN